MEIPASGKMTVGKSATYTSLLNPKARCMKKRPPFTMKTISKSVSVSRRLLNKFRFFIVTMVTKLNIFPTSPAPPRAATETPEPQNSNATVKWSTRKEVEWWDCRWDAEERFDELVVGVLASPAAAVAVVTSPQRRRTPRRHSMILVIFSITLVTLGLFSDSISSVMNIWIRKKCLTAAKGGKSTGGGERSRGTTRIGCQRLGERTCVSYRWPHGERGSAMEKFPFMKG